MFICSPQRSHSCQTPSCHRPVPPPTTRAQLWLRALDLTKHFKTQIPLFSWPWGWARWAVFEPSSLPARHPYSPKLVLLHLMAKLVVPPSALSEPSCVIRNATKAWKDQPSSLAPSPVPPSRTGRKGCPARDQRCRRGGQLRAGRAPEEAESVETLPSNSRGISQIRSLQWEVATWALAAFFHSPVTL